MPKYPIALSVPSECPSSQVLSECPSAWLSSKSPSRAQTSFRLVLTLTLRKTHFFEMRFKQIIIRFQLIQWLFLLFAYIISFRVEKNIKIFLYINNTLWDFQIVSFLGSWNIRGIYIKLIDVILHFSNYFCQSLSFRNWLFELKYFLFAWSMR